MIKLLCNSFLLFSITFTGASIAQVYPSKPVRVVVPFAPGSASDTVARSVAEKLTASMGQPFIVENRAGAGSTIGNDFVSKSTPDGYTLLISTAALPIGASAYSNLKYDTSAFVSVTVFTNSALALAVNPTFPAKNIGDFIEYVKANPDKVNFGSLGMGTSHHVTAEKLKLDAGINMVHVPYKGSAPAIVDLVSGQTHILIDITGILVPQVQSGTLKAIAITSPTRDKDLPNVPTVRESGFAELETSGWQGLVGPAGMPKEVVQKIQAALKKALANPDVRERLEKAGTPITERSSAEFANFIKSENDRWASVIKASGASMD